MRRQAAGTRRGVYAALSVPDIIAQRVSAPSALYAFVIAALVVGLIGTPLAIWAARRLGIVDRPGGRRIHAKPVPLLGGVAIMFGIVVAVTLNLPFTRDDYGAIVIGALLEGLPALLIFGPILFPISRAVGVDPVHYGIVIVAAINYFLTSRVRSSR